MKASHLILLNIDSRITTFLVYIKINTDSCHSLWDQSYQKFPMQFLHRLCSDKIIYGSNLKFGHTKIKNKLFIREKFKEKCETKNFLWIQNSRSIARIFGGLAAHIYNVSTRWKSMISFVFLPLCLGENRHCNLRVGGWMSHRGGQKFWRRAKCLVVTRSETHTFLHVE